MQIQSNPFDQKDSKIRGKKPCILLTNDDGVNSEGLWTAYYALNQIADVKVCAPATQQSAVGRSLSIFEPLRVNTVVHNSVTAYAVGGKPTDSVILALFALNIKPDLVVSGINVGENVSYEAITTSGTVGAALEAANQGYPAVAISLQIEDQKEKFGDARELTGLFHTTKDIVKEIILKILVQGFPSESHVININIPSVIKGGYEITRLADHLFTTGVEKRLDPRGKPYYWINGPLVTEAPDGTDVHAIHEGNISVTPITLDCTAYSGMNQLKTLFNCK